MSLKKKNTIFLLIVAVSFGLLYWMGTFAEGPKKRTGLGRSPVLSADGEEIIFSYYKKGDAALYTAPASGGKAHLLLQPKTFDSYVRPAYSPNGTKLLYIKEWEVEGKPYSQLMMYDFEKEQSLPLKDLDHYIKEAVFAPDGTHIYFIKAEGYQKSPNSERVMPEDYDIYKMNLDTYKTDRITTFNLYSLSSLQVSNDGKHLMFSLYNGKDLVQLLNLETKKVETIMPGPEYESGAANGPTIGSPALSPDGNSIAFSDVATSSENGTYLYEVFTMNINGDDVEQVTNFHEHVTSPAFFPEGEDLLVTVNQNFAGGLPDYEYWRVSKDGSERNEIIIEIPE
ncbi:TolB family protein [Halobacillus naozhouensis]|uniref:WD40-like Beta Propeller Repeat n=1 Tax=Halobacillus naozhouensis TaxID=554880 RepID=A0ABY8J1J4_9BACI|nr:hypothetical protein [Halobacillus naozhouensis]WFT76367.1 hypothetical protein P9989_08390 [Halobacillus naozhouensis]